MARLTQASTDAAIGVRRAQLGGGLPTTAGDSQEHADLGVSAGSAKDSPDQAPAPEPAGSQLPQNSERHGNNSAKIAVFDFLVDSDDLDHLDDEAKALRAAFAMHLRMLWLLMLSATRKQN